MSLIKKKAAPAAPQARSDLPYAGLVAENQPADDGSRMNTNAGKQAGELALSAPHLAVVGKTGSSKTRSVLAPAAVMWGDRPAIVMASKGDLAELTIRQRAKNGPVYLLDLSGEVRESELKNVPVTRVISDPCAFADTDDNAMNMASLLHAVGTLGAGGTGNSSDDSAQWKALATRPLAAFLRAGGWLPNFEDPDGDPVWGGGVLWAQDATLDIGDDINASAAAEADEDMDSPNWDSAYFRANGLLGSRHAQALRAAKKMDPKQRDSIGINCMMALTPWAMEAVAGDGTGTPFHPSMLEARGATLYIVAPFDGSAAPAATAVIMQSITHWRKRVGQLEPLLLVLDELANGAPLPALPQIVGEARGLGIRLLVGLQSSSQFEPRWGSAQMKVLRDNFPAYLLMPGVGGAEKELLEAAAWSTGEEERSTSSVDNVGNVSHAHDRVEAQTAAELLPRRRGQARLLTDGGPGILVDLPDIDATNLRAA
ncbi:type IV secretory system conjugative DNA transfer family protein [Microbacterium sp.]|uniref:type IV secretory system conjugative DNA transfer family protein n=1 Tax=Microbacterium sp. TaxID=51671 RepID=UPI0033404DFD